MKKTSIRRGHVVHCVGRVQGRRWYKVKVKVSGLVFAMCTGGFGRSKLVRLIELDKDNNKRQKCKRKTEKEKKLPQERKSAVSILMGSELLTFFSP